MFGWLCNWLVRRVLGRLSPRLRSSRAPRNAPCQIHTTALAAHSAPRGASTGVGTNTLMHWEFMTFPFCCRMGLTAQGSPGPPGA